MPALRLVQADPKIFHLCTLWRGQILLTLFQRIPRMRRLLQLPLMTQVCPSRMGIRPFQKANPGENSSETALPEAVW